MTSDVSDRAATGRVDGWIQQIVAGTPAPRNRVVVAASLQTLVVVIGIVDAHTGAAVSLSVFYVLPIALASIALGPVVAAVVSLESLVAWLVADNVFHGPQEAAVVGWNLLLRAAAFAGVVVVLRSLRSAVRASARSRRSTEEFLANAAHQLRTPVSGVMATAEALATDPDPATRARLTTHLTTSTERVGHLLHSLLQFASVSAGTTRRIEPFELVGLCGREVDHAQIRHPEVDFVLTGAPVVAQGDPRSTSEALANVLDNAGRHAANRVDVTVIERAGIARVEVSDDGDAVPPGMEEAIFDRFVTIGGHGGAGLGLPIARHLMEREGGGVELREGAFHVWLPTRARRATRRRSG